MKTIVLIGMMGSGKTTVGKALAEKLSVNFIDLDKEIENKQNMTISDIFSNFGQEYFRKIEYITLKKIFEPENLVISFGGGTFENAEIQRNVLKNSNVIFLIASPEIIYERIKNDKSRPLLKNNMNIEKINELLEMRNKNYKLAPYKILTDNKDINSVVLEILKCVKLM